MLWCGEYVCGLNDWTEHLPRHEREKEEKTRSCQFFEVGSIHCQYTEYKYTKLSGKWKEPELWCIPKVGSHLKFIQKLTLVDSWWETAIGFCLQLSKTQRHMVLSPSGQGLWLYPSERQACQSSLVQLTWNGICPKQIDIVMGPRETSFLPHSYQYLTQNITSSVRQHKN